LLDGVGGRYFEDCNQAPVIDPDAPSSTIFEAVYVLYPANSNRLCALSLAILGR
jgi:hypothetical protein